MKTDDVQVDFGGYTVQWEDVNSELPASSKNRKFAGFLEIRIVYDGKANFCLITMNHANVKKAYEFSFLKLTGSSKLTSSHCTLFYLIHFDLIRS